jgi:hypothetical protein
MGKHPLPGYGSVAFGKRQVRTRMLGVVGAGGENPPATRLANFCHHKINRVSIAQAYLPGTLFTPNKECDVTRPHMRHYPGPRLESSIWARPVLGLSLDNEKN